MPVKQGYAKGIAKREEILARALDVFAEKGYRKTSLREIAESVGLTSTGLLYHFASKEELFSEVLRKRDERGTESRGPDPDCTDVLDDFVAIVRQNTAVPGLVQLFATISVEAADPEHPGHPYFVERYTRLVGGIESHLRREQSEGRVRGDVDPRTLARTIIAVADGMQVQWLLDGTVDMAAALETLRTLLGSPTTETTE